MKIDIFIDIENVYFVYNVYFICISNFYFNVFYRKFLFKYFFVFKVSVDNGYFFL